MGFKTIKSAMANAAFAMLVDVEVDVSFGLPEMELTGNLSTSVKEGKNRARIAIKRSGFEFPQGKVTINIAPASIHKDGTGFDLPIACAILEEMGVVPEGSFDNYVVIGELALDGSVKGIRGILPVMMQAKKEGYRGVIVPFDNYEEARLLDGITVIPVDTLLRLVNVFIGIEDSYANTTNDFVEKKIEQIIDFAEISGQEHAKKALLTAVCGMHNIMFLGPPGAGKTMLASRVPTIMPDMTEEEGLELTCLYSLVGKVRDRDVVVHRPFRAPHHSITACALAGGGRPIMPGEVSLASKGVLFLDEITKYNQQTIEILREPLESGKIMINRINGSCELPADFMLISAMNPCNCGYFPDRNKCTCTEMDIKRHYGRISKPILDRIDMSIYLNRVTFDELTDDRKNTINNEYTSINMKKRVKRAWEIQNQRLGNGHFNSKMNNEQIVKFCNLDKECLSIMRNAYDKYNLSARSYHKVLKVARTIADMDERDRINVNDIYEALSYRLKIDTV